MSSQSQERISFEVETSRVLEILSKEIYDSPNALLRENVQNAYDAILMRRLLQNLDWNDMTIDISVNSSRLKIVDNGIGMTEEVLRNNFWKAGSSGKSTALAKQSGVIGTFGIGAMANFGVCSRLCIETRYVDSDLTLISTAEREKLVIAENCIELDRRTDQGPIGTTLIADIDPTYSLNEANVRAYLESYVRFLPVRVFLNGNLISQQSFRDSIADNCRGYEQLSSKQVSHSIYYGTLGRVNNQSSQI